MKDFVEVVVSIDFITINSLEYEDIHKINEFLESIYSRIIIPENIAKSKLFGKNNIEYLKKVNYVYTKCDMDNNQYCCGLVIDPNFMDDIKYSIDKIKWTLFKFLNQMGWSLNSVASFPRGDYAGYMHYYFSR